MNEMGGAHVGDPPAGRPARALAASLAGTGTATLLQLIFIPVFVNLLGIEAYGLLGFYVGIFGAAQVLDIGLSPALNRDLAGLASRPGDAQAARNLVRSIETGYLALGALLGLALIALAPWFADGWFHDAELPRDTILAAFRWMGVLLAVQWPISLYQSGLIGLERQVDFNVVNVIAALAAHAGGALLLWSTGPSLPKLIAWLAAINFLRAAALGVLLWRGLPATPAQPRFEWAQLQRIAPYATGLAIGGAAGLLLAQLDRFAVGRALPLADLGRYSLAANVILGMSQIAIAVYNVVFPRLSAVREARPRDLAAQFHVTAQIIGVLVVPIGLVLTVFATDVFTLWTGSAEQGAAIGPAAALLAAGSTLNALAVAPYALQLAARWTRASALLSVAQFLLALPLWWWLPMQYGLPGAAGVWLIVNAVGLIVQAWVTFAHLLPGERWAWLRSDILPTTGAALGAVLFVSFGASWLAPNRVGLAAALTIAAAAALALGAALAASVYPRRAVAAWLNGRFHA